MQQQERAAKPGSPEGGDGKAAKRLKCCRDPSEGIRASLPHLFPNSLIPPYIQEAPISAWLIRSNQR